MLIYNDCFPLNSPISDHHVCSWRGDPLAEEARTSAPYSRSQPFSPARRRWRQYVHILERDPTPSASRPALESLPPSPSSIPALIPASSRTLARRSKSYFPCGRQHPGLREIWRCKARTESRSCQRQTCPRTPFRRSVANGLLGSCCIDVCKRMTLSPESPQQDWLQVHFNVGRKNTAIDRCAK